MRTVTRILAPLVLLLAMLLPAGGATAAPAETVHGDTIFFEYNNCNGEFVVVEGKYTIVSKQQKDGSFVQHATFHAKGVGSQGNEYVLNYNHKFQSETFDYSYDQRILLVSKGSAPNEWVKVHFDSDGNFTIESDCRG